MGSSFGPPPWVLLFSLKKNQEITEMNRKTSQNAYDMNKLVNLCAPLLKRRTESIC